MGVVGMKWPVRVGEGYVHFHLMRIWFGQEQEEMWEKDRLLRKSHRLVGDGVGMQSIHLVGRRTLPGMLVISDMI